MNTLSWPPRNEFTNRVADLAEMERWWNEDRSRDALAMVGRRRVGKSWLFRRFCDGKPAVILVADRLLLSTQMARFADELEPVFGLRPDISSVAQLIRLLYQLGAEEKVLVVIDEFPFLLPERGREAMLSEVQAVMEAHRDVSQTKLILCGSLVSQMESLLASVSPLHGRLRKLDVWPLTFGESREMTSAADSPEQRVTRYAVAGGMARYLAALGHGALRDVVCENALNSRSQLFDDPRAVLEQELRSPAMYFSILEALAEAPASTEHLTDKLQVSAQQLSSYMETLRDMRLLSSTQPVGAPENARSYKHRVSDGFIRFWFRFVFANQDGLQEGLTAQDVWDGDIAPYLADFVAPTFEELCTRYTRRVYGARAQRVGGWWGPALIKYRQTKERLAEEVDVVAAHRRNLVLAGECKWTTEPMPQRVLDDLREYKIAAIAQERRLRVPREGPDILLFARSGFSDQLRAAAQTDDRVTLVDLEQLVNELDREAEHT